MKKVVCMLITSVMVVSTLSGCFGESEQEKLARSINEATAARKKDIADRMANPPQMKSFDPFKDPEKSDGKTDAAKK